MRFHSILSSIVFIENEKKMKFLSAFRNMCVIFYKSLCINFYRICISILNMCLVYILYIKYDIYTGDFEYCISHEIENNLKGDSSTSEQTKQIWEFNRHNDDLGNSTIRLVCQTPDLANAPNNPICSSASTVSENTPTSVSDEWSTRAVVGLHGDNQSDLVDGHSNSENTSIRDTRSQLHDPQSSLIGNSSNTGQDLGNLSGLGARIDDTIREINEGRTTSSTLLGEVPSGESLTVDESTRAEAIHSMRWALTIGRDTSRLTPNDIERLGHLLQQLGEAERELSANAPDVVDNNNSNWTVETNNSNRINWDMRRDYIRQEVDNQIERDMSKQVETQYNKIEKIKSDIDILKCKIESLYNKYYNAGKRRLFWNIWEKYRGNFETYKEFKEYSGPDMKIRTELKRFWEENGNPFARNKDIYRKR